MNKRALDHSLEFIDSWLRLRYGQEEIPGYVVAIAHKGKVLLNAAYGYADLATQTKITPQHIFRIASHSKTFTATALMQLVEQDRIRLEDYVVKYLPWLNHHTDLRWEKVTVRQLMSHGAGVIRDGLNADYWQLDRPFPSEQQLKKEVLEAELVADNNTKLKYSNFGYSLLGLVIEAVTGQPYNNYVTEHIVKPLGLKDTGPDFTPSINTRLVTGYTRRDVNKTRVPIAQIDTRAMAAATGFYSTAEDLCTYLTAQFVGSGQLLSDELKKEMQRVHWHVKQRPSNDTQADYGLGIEVMFVDKHRTIGHGGGFPGQITKSMADPRDELVVVVLTNCIDGPASSIAKSIYKIIDYYQNNTPTTKPKHVMARLEGCYMNLWTMINIVVTGDKVIAISPDTWEPLTDSEELEYVDDTTLKVIDTNSFASEGELVHFTIKNGKVESVNYNGATMWPEDVWLKKQQGREVIA
jgi:D-alanyl-D-alanine carboxypeptidase